jgi:hypothetical protein
MENSDN